MKKSILILIFGIALFQNSQAQNQSDDLRSPFDSFQKEMMKMLEQMGFEGMPFDMKMDTFLIQPFSLSPGSLDSLQNQDFMQQWRSMSEQLLKSFQDGQGGMEGFEELFKNFPLFDENWVPPTEEQDQSKDGTRPKNKKRKIYKI